MKKFILLLLLVCFSKALFAQYEVTIEATLLDKETKQPIEFVNIEFLKKSIKTISNNDGTFVFNYDNERIGKMDMLQFTAFGYKTEKVSAYQFYRFLKNTNKIYLVPEGFALEKIVINSNSINNNPNRYSGSIYGSVTSESRPLQAATIRIKNTFTEAQTDVDGNYSINAKESDVLVVNYLGMKEKKVLVSTSNNINIALESDGEVLEEVFLESKAKKDELIDLGVNGKKSFDAVGYDVKTLKAEDINKPQYYNFEDVINGKFANVSASFDLKTGNTVVSIARQGSINNNAGGALIDLDGALYKSIPPFDVQNIESIVIIKSLAGAVKYGNEARGGVIVIRTKNFAASKIIEPVESALIKNNDYEEELPLLNNNKKKKDYISLLENAVSYKDALSIYKIQQEEAPELSIPYLLDVSGYFMRWDKDYAYTILSNITEIAYDNPKALKTLAYKLEELGKLEEAKHIYQRIAVLRPKDAQSYRDLALVYEQTGYYTEAMELYGQMLNNKIGSVDFSGLQQPITSELQHLLALHRSKVNYSNVHADYLRASFKYDLRIVFDWNDASTEFEVQFVNPKKKYFTWSQTKLKNRERMLDGITKGYHTEEFIIDEDKAGEWMINIESLNDEPQLNPTYLKYTVFRNYGLANETKTVKVINLNNFKPKITFDKLASN